MSSNGVGGITALGTKLRRKLEAGEFILAPGVYDGFSARIALEVGFDAIYMVFHFSY